MLLLQVLFVVLIHYKAPPSCTQSETQSSRSNNDFDTIRTRPTMIAAASASDKVIRLYFFGVSVKEGVLFFAAAFKTATTTGASVAFRKCSKLMCSRAET